MRGSPKKGKKGGYGAKASHKSARAATLGAARKVGRSKKAAIPMGRMKFDGAGDVGV